MVKIINQSIDIVILSYQFINSNRKAIITTIIGLILALSVIAESNIIIDSQKRLIFDEFVVEQTDSLIGDIIVEGWTEDYDNVNSSGGNFNWYSKKINDTLKESDYWNRYLKQRWQVRSSVTTPYNFTYYDEYEDKNSSFIDYQHMNVIVPEEEYYTKTQPFLISGSRIPENYTEVLVARNSKRHLYNYYDNQFEIELGDTFNISYSSWRYKRHENLTMENLTVTVVGVIDIYTLDWEDSIDILSEQDRLFYEYILPNRWRNSDFTIITNFPFMNSIANHLNPTNAEDLEDVEVIGKIYLDYYSFDTFNLATESIKLKKVLENIETTFVYSSMYMNANSGILDRISEFNYVIQSITMVLFLINIPVIGIALYLVSYSFGLIKKQKREKIGIIKTRGGSWTQILTCLIGELIVSVFIGAIVGLIIGYILTNVVLRSTDFLTFTGVELPIVVSPTSLENLITYSFIFSILLNGLNTFRMSRMSILESTKPVEKDLPLWKRKYLDVVSLGLGALGFYVIFEMARFSSNPSEEGINPLIAFLFVILGIPSPFLLFFGSILLIARVFPYLAQIISSWAWKTFGGLGAFSLRNIVRHKQVASRAVILVTLALSFSVISASLIDSVRANQKMSTYYWEGADMKIHTGLVQNDTLQSILSENISGIQSVSRIIKAGASVNIGSSYKYYELLFVDPLTYSKTAFFKDSAFGLSQPLNDLMKKIEDNSSIIYYKSNLKAHDLEIGENLTILTTENEGIDLIVAGTFTCWPTMWTDSWDPLRSNYLVGSLGLFEKLFNNYTFIDYHDNEYLLNLEKDVDAVTVQSDILNQTNKVSSSAIISYSNYLDSFSWKFFLVVLNSDFIICIAVAVTGIVMFAFHTYIERGKEIGVERALGMTKNQTGLSFLIEGFVVLVFGVFVGFLTGGGLTFLFMYIIQMGQTVPPLIIEYPMEFFFRLLIVILGIGAIGTLIPAYLASKKDISRILKVE